MRRRLVESASIRSVGYDVATRTLELEYVNGSVYQYYDVPQPTFAGLLAIRETRDEDLAGPAPEGGQVPKIGDRHRSAVSD